MIMRRHLRMSTLMGGWLIITNMKKPNRYGKFVCVSTMLRVFKQVKYKEVIPNSDKV